MSLVDAILPVAATAVSQAILNAVGALKLEPLPDWGWNAGITSAGTYVVASGTAAVACLLTARRNGTKALLIVIGLLAFLASLRAYTWVISPANLQNSGSYDWVGYISFFATYSSYGFVVARVIKFFSK
jgi:hypothetical protein